MAEDKNKDISITVVYPVTFRESNVIEHCTEPEKKQKIIKLFNKAKEDKLEGDELEELKEVIKDTADRCFEISSIDPVIHQSALDILID